MPDVDLLSLSTPTQEAPDSNPRLVRSRKIFNLTELATLYQDQATPTPAPWHYNGSVPTPAPLQDAATLTRAPLPDPISLSRATRVRNPEQTRVCIVTQAGLPRVMSENDFLPSADGYQRDEWTIEDRHESHTITCVIALLQNVSFLREGAVGLLLPKNHGRQFQDHPGRIPLYSPIFFPAQPIRTH